MLLALIGLTLTTGTTIAAAPSAPAAPEPVRRLAERVRRSVVEVVGTLESGGDTTYGTGFVLSEPNLVVTNAHVVRGAKDLRVRTLEGASLASVEVLESDEALDLAVLRVVGLNLPPLEPAAGPPPPIGQRVVAVGHPRGYEFTVSDGIVSAMRKLQEDGIELIQTTAPISPGSSGGPLVDLDAHVVGVCSLTLTEGQNINFAIPVREVPAVIAKALAVEKGLKDPDPEKISPARLAEIVRRHREKGDLTRAADLAGRALNVHPKDLSLLLEAAEVAWSKGSLTEVRALVDRMARVAPGYAPAHQIRATVLAEDGKCDEAMREAEAALTGALDAQHQAEAHAVLAECLGRAGRPVEALQHIEAALASPKIAALPDYHVLHAFVLQALGRADDADRAAVEALEQAGFDPLVVAALRERELPRLIEIVSQRQLDEGPQTVVRGIVRNRGPIALTDIAITAEGASETGTVVATGTAKITPVRLVPGQTGAFRIVLEGDLEHSKAVTVRVVDYKEN